MNNSYYFYDDNTNIIYYTDEFPKNNEKLIYIGTSDNPSKRMAAAALTHKMKIDNGYRLREMT